MDEPLTPPRGAHGDGATDEQGEGAAATPAPSSAYGRALDALFARTAGAIKPGLERTEALLHALGDPHRALRCLHVAGTNGKGSSVAMATPLLRAEGLRVGSYTSPHLTDFRERIVVDGERIPAEVVLRFLQRWEREVERLGATFFEVTTALALDHFRRSGVDVAVLETGLGGRLDATNVVHPLSAGVTSIGLDHQEYLGGTLEGIAAEKAGIFKRGVPAVIGEREPGVRAMLRRAAEERGAAPIVEVAAVAAPRDVQVSLAGTAFTLPGERRLTTGLVGAHQAWNAAFTLEWLRAAGGREAASIARAEAVLPTVRIAGRFERVGPWLFDVAHNADGIRTLVRTLREAAPPRPLAAVVCILGDKDWRTMLAELVPHVDHLVLTDAPTAPAARRWPLHDAAEAARRAVASGGADVRVEADFERALELGRAAGATTLVTGSFHTVGDAKDRLPGSPANG